MKLWYSLTDTDTEYSMTYGVKYIETEGKSLRVNTEVGTSDQSQYIRSGGWIQMNIPNFLSIWCYLVLRKTFLLQLMERDRDYKGSSRSIPRGGTSWNMGTFLDIVFTSLSRGGPKPLGTWLTACLFTSDACGSLSRSCITGVLSVRGAVLRRSWGSAALSRSSIVFLRTFSNSSRIRRICMSPSTCWGTKKTLNG